MRGLHDSADFIIILYQSVRDNSTVRDRCNIVVLTLCRVWFLTGKSVIQSIPRCAIRKEGGQRVDDRIDVYLSADTAQRSHVLRVCVLVLCPQLLNFDVQTETQAQPRTVFIRFGNEGPKTFGLPFVRPHLVAWNDMVCQADLAYH